jgi:hypothetical protein
LEPISRPGCPYEQHSFSGTLQQIGACSEKSTISELDSDVPEQSSAEPLPALHEDSRQSKQCFRVVGSDRAATVRCITLIV